MIADEEWDEMKVAEKREWLRKQVLELGVSMVTMTVAVKHLLDKENVREDEVALKTKEIDDMIRELVLQHNHPRLDSRAARLNQEVADLNAKIRFLQTDVRRSRGVLKAVAEMVGVTVQ